MDKEIISDKQGIKLVALFIMGSTLVLGAGTEAGKDLFDITECIFNKYLGKIISILYIWFAFHLGILILRNLGEFIHTVSLQETPMIIPMTVIMILCTWGIKNGIEVLGRWSGITMIILIFLIASSILFLLPNMKISNIQPMFFNNIKPILRGAFSVLAFPFAETVIFCLVFSSLERPNSSYKIYTLGLLIGGVTVFSTVFTEILILGENYYTKSYYPSHRIVSRINIGGFIQRVEIIISIALLASGFIKLSMCLLGVCKGIAKTLGFKNYIFIVTPVSLLILNLSYLIYDSTMEMTEWAFKIWRYYAFPFQFILPIIILSGCLIKKNK